jgi:protein-arginine kinase activator protein McsA
LRLRTTTSEEISKRAEITNNDIETVDETWQPEDKISSEQKTIIDLLCKQCNIDVADFINSGSQKYTNIDDISKGVASTMVQHLNKIRSDGANKPNGVGNYKC